MKTNFIEKKLFKVLFVLLLTVLFMRHQTGWSINSFAAEKTSVPKAPEVSVTVGINGNPKITWKAIEGAQTYRIYRKTVDDEKYVRIGKTKGTEFTDTEWDAPKKSEIKYFVRVYNKDADGNGIFGQISKPASWKVPGKRIHLNFTEKTVMLGEYSKLKLRNNTADIVWSTSDSKTVKVSQKGTILGVRRGTCEITAEAGGVKYVCRVTVEVPAPEMREIDPAKPIVALSFDDGPSIYTSRILDTLASYGATATFFEVGYNIDRYPDTVLQIYQSGCEVGNHTLNHANLKTLSAEKADKEINGNLAKLNKIIGDEVRLFRPPYGNYNDTVKSVCNAPIIIWSDDTRDWSSLNAQEVLKEVQKSARDGYIILMHSLYKSSADAVELVVPWLISQGYQVCSVSEMFEARGVELKNGSVYSMCMSAAKYIEQNK